MCSSRKNPYPPHGRSLEIPKGCGGLYKAKFLEAIYKDKLEFPGGRGSGAKQKNLTWGEYGYFLELHNDLAWGSIDISWNCTITVHVG